MRVNRDQFLEEGYVILRHCIPPEMLDAVRTACEKMVDRQRTIWASERAPDDPAGGVWETAAQPRLHLQTMQDQIDAETALSIEIWLHENLQGASSELLGLEDAAVTEMMMMCSPVRDHGPAKWHRDFYPPYCAPLQGYADDILENGPRYVQWNIPLYDDDVLWVVPKSHIRRNTEEENRQLTEDNRAPLASGVQTHLNAGDGVAYILPILHWGSNYSTKLRRTIHGGFSDFTHYPDLSYLEHLSPAAQTTFSRWDQHSHQKLGPNRGRAPCSLAKGRRSLPHRTRHPASKPRPQGPVAIDAVFEQSCAPHPPPQTTRFCRASSPRPTLRHQHAPDDLAVGATHRRPLFSSGSRCAVGALQARGRRPPSPELQWAPGFQGEDTHYYLNDVPADLSVERFIANWDQKRSSAPRWAYPSALPLAA